MKFFNLKLFLLTISLGLIGGCGGYPRLLNFPFDTRGRSLNSPALEVQPQISSQFIVFVSDRNGSQDIYLYDAQQRRLVDLPTLNSFDEVAANPSISEDGRYIVFTLSRQGRSDIYIYDRTTLVKRNLTANLQAQVRNPSISADGSRITFEIAADGQWDIAVYNRSGQPLNLP
ncbi:TolB family protein [Myxosarcina sp. GI1(2024)]